MFLVISERKISCRFSLEMISLASCRSEGFLVLLKWERWSIRAKAGVLSRAEGCKREARVKMAGNEQNQDALIRARRNCAVVFFSLAR